MTTLRCLFDSSAITQDIIHYSKHPRAETTDIKVTTRYQDKCPEALHFAFGTRWRDIDIKTKPYHHKYKLTNVGKLKLLEISRRTMTELLPLPLSCWGIDWKAIQDRGYDGVFVAHDDLYYGGDVPNGCYRWKVFAHCFDINTFVIWSGAKLEELPNDWPELSADKLQEYYEFEKRMEDNQPLVAAERAARDKEMMALPLEERRKRRNSFEVRRDGTAEEVDEMRIRFPGWDDHYPIRPPMVGRPLTSENTATRLVLRESMQSKRTEPQPLA